MKYLLLFLLVLVVYQYVKDRLPKLIMKKSDKERSGRKGSLDIREEDIRDAEFEDIDKGDED